MFNINAALPQLSVSRKRNTSPQPYLRSPPRHCTATPKVISSLQSLQPVFVKEPEYRNPNKMDYATLLKSPASYSILASADHVAKNIKHIKQLEASTATKRLKITYEYEIKRIIDFKADEMRIADNIHKEMQLLLAYQEREYEMALRQARYAATVGERSAADTNVRLNILQLDTVRHAAKLEEQRQGQFHKFVFLALSQINDRLHRRIPKEMTRLAMDNRRYVTDSYADLLANILVYNPFARVNRYVTLAYAKLLMVCSANVFIPRFIIRTMTALALPRGKKQISLHQLDCIVEIMNFNPLVPEEGSIDRSELASFAFTLLQVYQQFYFSDRRVIRKLMHFFYREKQISAFQTQRITSLITTSFDVVEDIFSRKNMRVFSKQAIAMLVDNNISLTLAETLVFLASDQRKLILQINVQLICRIVHEFPF